MMITMMISDLIGQLYTLFCNIKAWDLYVLVFYIILFSTLIFSIRVSY